MGLGLADFTEGGDEPGESMPGSGHTNTFDGVAIGDSTAAAGTWNGTFHGNASTPRDNRRWTPNSPQPGSVVGEFNANFTDGTAAGGFGANKQ